MIVRLLHFLLNLIEGKHIMPIDPTTGLDVPDLGVATPTAPAAPEPVSASAPEAQASDPAPVPAAPAAPTPPRSLDAIKSDTDAARAAHQAAVDAVRATHEALKALAAEYRAAVSYLDQDCADIEAEVSKAQAAAEGSLEGIVTKLKAVL